MRETPQSSNDLRRRAPRLSAIVSLTPTAPLITARPFQREQCWPDPENWSTVDESRL